MAVKRFSGTFKTRNDVFDNITPNNIVVTPTGGIAVPAGEFKPADWLPVAWQGTASQDYFVISSGKVVSLDAQGRVCPSGIRVTANAGATGATLITYTTNDVTAGTIDIRTGQPVQAAGAVTIAAFAAGVLERGLVSEARAATIIGGDFTAGVIAEERVVINEFISLPVGICAYDVYHWAGDAYDPEGGLNFNNYQKQHLVQFFTQAQMQLPLGGAVVQATPQNLTTYAAWNTATPAHGTVFPTASRATNGIHLTSTQLSTLERYDDSTKPSMYVAAGDPVSGYSLVHAGTGHAGTLCPHTSRTPFADGNSVLLNLKTSIADLSVAGDYFIDHEANLLIVFSSWDATGGTPASIAATSLTYYYQDNRAGASSTWQQAAAMGDMFPGDFVTYDAFSNLCRLDFGAAWTAGIPTSAANNRDIVGRVLAIKEEPAGLLDRVRTAFDGTSFGASMQMPGSATSGYTDLITLSNETVAQKVAVINVSFV